MSETKNINDPIPAIDRATAVAVNLYDQAALRDDAALRTQVLMLLAHLRMARKAAV